jgi:hypothetical protein
MTYAKPKAAWIERYAEMRKGISSDARERMARRRDHYHSIVEPNEISVLPPLPESVGATSTLDETDAMGWQNAGIPFVRRLAH